VPDHHGRWPIAEHPRFTNLVEESREQGSEVFLHGLIHLADEPDPTGLGPVERLKARWLTAGEGEFQDLSFDEAKSRLRKGADALEETLGHRPRGFIAPAWLENPETERALISLGFEFHEDHLFLKDLQRNRKHLVPAITFTARSPLRIRLSLGWSRVMGLAAKTGVDLRLALHPLDFGHDELVDAIGVLASKIGRHRRWMSYRELLSDRA